jgi:two-component system, NtrC family, sensor kinase
MTWFKEKAVVSAGAKQLLNEVIRIIQELFNNPHCAILLPDSQQKLLYVVSSSGYRRKVLHNFRIAIGKEGVTGWVAKHKRPLYVPDVRKEPRYIQGVIRGRSELAVPLLIGRQLIGVLDVESRRLDAFTPKDIKILSLFATQAAVAILNSQLYEQERKKSAQLRLINHVSRKMATTLDRDRLLPLLVKAIQRKFDYHHVMILIKDTNDELVMKAQAGGFSSLSLVGYQQKISEGIIGAVAREGRTILANDVSQNRHYSCVHKYTRAELCVPIRLGHEVIGVINVESDQLNAFDQFDQEILEIISDQLANVIKNARIYQECKQAKDYLQKLIESSSDAVTTADNLGRLIFWSKGAEEIFGYRAKEVLGRSATSFYAKGRDEARRIMWQLVKKGKLKNLEVEYIGKNGKKIYASLSASLLRDEHGAVSGSLGIIRDITEYKVLGQQLLQSERLATIGKLSTQIGHEIMNPLSSIKMNIRILSKREGLSANDQRRLAIARFEIDHLEKILQDIFDYSKSLQLSFSRESLNEILDKSLLIVQDRLEDKRIAVTRKYDSQLPHLSVDLVRIMQVFTNVYLNAIHAMGQGGKLKVSTSREQVNGTRYVKASVSDNGPGITPSQRAVIFDPFYTTKSDGTGLGLTIVKKIVEQHAGKIEVKSRVGQFTRFHVLLPAERKT